MNVPEDLKYADTHEWIRVEDGVGTVGITDHAQAELSDIVFVELPQVGVEFAARNAVAVVESVKAASDIYTPVSGEIVEVNSALEGEPGLLNTAPYEGGWLFKIRLSDPGELDALLSAEAYREQLSQ